MNPSSVDTIFTRCFRNSLLADDPQLTSRNPSPQDPPLKKKKKNNTSLKADATKLSVRSPSRLPCRVEVFPMLVVLFAITVRMVITYNCPLVMFTHGCPN